MIIHTLGSIAERSVSNRDQRPESAPLRPTRTDLRSKLPAMTTRLEALPSYRSISHVSPLLPTLAAHAPVREAGAGPHPHPFIGRPLDAAEGGVRNTPIMEMVIGNDDRVVVPAPHDSPWRQVCALRITTTSQKSYVGTGWFIGPRTVMTAGHCVFMRDEGGWVASIDVIPALNGTEEPYGETQSTHFKAVREWTEGDGDSNYDFGAILLDNPVGEQTGWFAFASLPDATLAAAVANISGYPVDRDNATRQYYHARQLLGVQERRLVYDIDTYGGQSGSAIWLTLEDGRVAVGIHTTGASTTNSGTRITQEVFGFMERWRQDADERTTNGQSVTGTARQLPGNKAGRNNGRRPTRKHAGSRRSKPRATTGRT